MPCAAGVSTSYFQAVLECSVRFNESMYHNFVHTYAISFGLHNGHILKRLELCGGGAEEAIASFPMLSPFLDGLFFLKSCV